MLAMILNGESVYASPIYASSTRGYVIALNEAGDALIRLPLHSVPRRIFIIDADTSAFTAMRGKWTGIPSLLKDSRLRPVLSGKPTPLSTETDLPCAPALPDFFEARREEDIDSLMCLTRYLHGAALASVVREGSVLHLRLLCEGCRVTLTLEGVTVDTLTSRVKLFEKAELTLHGGVFTLDALNRAGESIARVKASRLLWRLTVETVPYKATHKGYHGIEELYEDLKDISESAVLNGSSLTLSRAERTLTLTEIADGEYSATDSEPEEDGEENGTFEDHMIYAYAREFLLGQELSVREKPIWSSSPSKGALLWRFVPVFFSTLAFFVLLGVLFFKLLSLSPIFVLLFFILPPLGIGALTLISLFRCAPPRYSACHDYVDCDGFFVPYSSVGDVKKRKSPFQRDYGDVILLTDSGKHILIGIRDLESAYALIVTLWRQDGRLRRVEII